MTAAVTLASVITAIVIGMAQYVARRRENLRRARILSMTWAEIVAESEGTSKHQRRHKATGTESSTTNINARPPETEALVRDLATIATDGQSRGDRLTAGIAALAVAQLAPEPESRLKAYIWPLVIAVVGLFGPLVGHLADRVDRTPVDCSKYLAAVDALPTIAPDRASLRRLAARFHPEGDVVHQCGGTPVEILRAAGRID